MTHSSMISLKKASLFFVTASALLFTACNKNDDNDADISEDEAAEVVVQAVSDESGGLVLQIQIASETAEYNILDCGEESDTSFSGQSSSGATISYNYAMSMSRTMICDNGLPQLYNFALSGQSSYTAPRMSSSDNTTASFQIAGLDAASSAFTFNESYARKGSQQSSVRYQRSITSDLTITSSNITVDKSTYAILSGTATVSLSATSSSGAAVTYGATLEFLGNQQARLTFDNGGVYDIEW